MKKAALLISLAAGITLVAGIAAPAVAAPRLAPEAQLAKLLDGRVPGKPVNCIDPRINSQTRIVDHTAIVYGWGRTVYLQRPDNADSLRDDDVLVTTLHGTGQLCNVDIVRLHDRSGAWYKGFVGLNQFVPYTRPRTALRD